MQQKHLLSVVSFQSDHGRDLYTLTLKGSKTRHTHDVHKQLRISAMRLSNQFMCKNKWKGQESLIHKNTGCFCSSPAHCFYYRDRILCSNVQVMDDLLINIAIQIINLTPITLCCTRYFSIFFRYKGSEQQLASSNKPHKLDNRINKYKSHAHIQCPFLSMLSNPLHHCQ